MHLLEQSCHSLLLFLHCAALNKCSPPRFFLLSNIKGKVLMTDVSSQKDRKL